MAIEPRGTGTLGTAARADRIERSPAVDQSLVRANDLLRGLPAAEREELFPLFDFVSLGNLELLSRAGDTPTYVYFPADSIISMLRPIDDTYVEAGLVGCEGLAEISGLLDVPWSPATLLVQAPGNCMRIPCEAARAALRDLPTFAHRVRRFALAALDQTMQTAACNARHSVVRRCARWLLMTHDRVSGDSLALTHDVLAQMLGVRRAGVTVAAGELQRAGAIHYHRGHITVVDRARLEAASCECYRANRASARLLLGDFMSNSRHG